MEPGSLLFNEWLMIIFFALSMIGSLLQIAI